MLIRRGNEQPNAEQEAAQWRNKLASKQPAVVDQPHESPRHEPVLEAERILMVDFVSTQARAKVMNPSSNCERS
jgi:hypothetical protein